MFFRLFFAGVFLATGTFAAPPLTRIQDVLYKADGTRFVGTLTISWKSFQASDNSTVVQQITSVKVTDGNLRVQLVPSTTATPTSVYQVAYSADGRVQFRETWAVPPSPNPLRVPDVRTESLPGGGSGGPPAAVGTIEEADVIGLVDDLEARPVKGPSYSPGHTAIINSLGQIETATGQDGDCVHVDGTSGPCGITPPGFVDNEVPTGIVDGSNAVFTVAGQPEPVTSVAVYRNGVLQKLATDYTVNLRDIQFTTASIPQPGDLLLVSYRLNGVDPSQAALFPLAQVLCSGIGGSTNSDSFSNVGACTIPAALLSAGDRLELRFDYQHQGAGSGFTVDVQWGGTTVLNRDAPPNELLVTGRADAGLYLGGAQLSAQSWGGVLPLAVTVSSATDAYPDGIVILFRGKLTSATGDTLTLRHFSVVRLP